VTREAVWLALSELWLDTELQPFQHTHIARVLQDSDLPLEEIEAILLYEVAPVVWRNAQCVAGVWTGFDPDWLIDACRRNQQRRESRWHRLRCRLLKQAMLGPVKEDWAIVVARQ
jgi:hypothetical protein